MHKPDGIYMYPQRHNAGSRGGLLSHTGERVLRGVKYPLPVGFTVAAVHKSIVVLKQVGEVSVNPECHGKL